MPALYPQYGNSPEEEPIAPSQERKPTSVPWSTRVSDAASKTGEMAKDLFVMGTTRPSKRVGKTDKATGEYIPYGNKGREVDALGSGKEWYNDLEYGMDSAQAAIQLGASLTGKEIGNAVLDGEFIKGPRAGMSRLQRFGRAGTNIGVGLVGGFVTSEVGEHIAEKYDDTSDLENDLAAARYYGDDETVSRIIDAINSSKTKASDARTISHGLSTGMNAGLYGTAAGGIAAGGVVGLRHAMGGEKHMNAPDPAFMKEYKARQAQNVINAFSSGDEKGPLDPDSAIDVILEKLRRGSELEMDFEDSKPDQKTIDAIFDYIRREGKGDPEFMKKANMIGDYLNETAKLNITDEVAEQRFQKVSKYPDRDTLRKKFNKK